jgi:ABC-type nitrate/sulfonate/bicarbonate transport system substrate-binding protein
MWKLLPFHIKMMGKDIKGEAKMSSRRWGLVAAIASALALVLGLSACGGGSSATADGSSGGETTTIRYQAAAGTISPLEIADALGYLGNLQIKSVGDVTGGPESIQAVATGQADVSSIAFDGSIVKAIAAGANVKAVVGAYGSNKLSYAALYMLAGSPIKTAKDLIGKKIGVNTLGANEEAFIKLWLKKEGLSADEIGEVQFVVIPPVNAEEALREEQLDGVVLGGALAELAVSNGGVTPIAKDIDVLGDYTGNSLVMNDDFTESNPETTATLVSGLAKAIAWLQTTPRAAVIKEAEKVAVERGRPEDKESLKFWKSQGVANKGGVIEPKEFSTWIKLQEEEGELQSGQVTLADAYTNQFNPYSK